MYDVKMYNMDNSLLGVPRGPLSQSEGCEYVEQHACSDTLSSYGMLLTKKHSHLQLSKYWESSDVFDRGTALVYMMPLCY